MPRSRFQPRERPSGGQEAGRGGHNGRDSAVNGGGAAGFWRKECSLWSRSKEPREATLALKVAMMEALRIATFLGYKSRGGWTHPVRAI